MILKLVKEREALTSAEMRELIFGRPAGKRRSDEPVDSTVFVRPPRQCLEGALQRLQMGGRLLIADFQYKYTRKGERYGWGVALYSTPEIWFEQPAFPVPRSAEESFSLLVDYLGERLPDISRPVIEKLLK